MDDAVIHTNLSEVRVYKLAITCTIYKSLIPHSPDSTDVCAGFLYHLQYSATMEQAMGSLEKTVLVLCLAAVLISSTEGRLKTRTCLLLILCMYQPIFTTSLDAQ